MDFSEVFEFVDPNDYLLIELGPELLKHAISD